MSRWVSLIVLLAIIVVTSVALYRVMASFLLPLFLASVLTVIFRPLHLRVVRRMPRHPSLASLLTTCFILLTVLLPLCGLVTFAVHEALGAMSGSVVNEAEAKIEHIRGQLGLELPFRRLPREEGEVATSLMKIDHLMESLPPVLPDFEQVDQTLRRRLDELAKGLSHLVFDIDRLAKSDSHDATHATDLRCVKQLISHRGDRAFVGIHEIKTTIDLVERYANEGPDIFPLPSPYPRTTHSEVSTQTDDATSLAPSTPTALDEADLSDEMVTVTDLRWRYGRIHAAYTAFRVDLIGGPLRSWLTDLANPSNAQIESWRVNLHQSVRKLLPTVAGQATTIVGSSLLGLAILALSVFYFLKDGPSMIQALMKLSPLEDKYEEELIGEFESVSRAVVLATLLSALAQGILAGVAYFFVGFKSIFLLTGLTIIFALIPFIGAAAIWIPASLWLLAVENRYGAGIALFIYGATIVSMADNVIKPYVLHGQSKLHPLLALLSVLGGVQALGPIGILVGPMVVSFLQALLNILEQELRTLDKPVATAR